MAERIGTDEETVLETLRSLKEKGVMRRFSAILYHRRAGFKANGMAVWKVPEDRIDEVGLYLASFRSVSHCYLKTTNGRWEHSLFSMIHGKEREEVEEFRNGEEEGAGGSATR